MPGKYHISAGNILFGQGALPAGIIISAAVYGIFASGKVAALALLGDFSLLSVA